MKKESWVPWMINDLFQVSVSFGLTATAPVVTEMWTSTEFSKT